MFTLKKERRRFEKFLFNEVPISMYGLCIQLNPDDSVLIGAWEKEQEEANEALRKIHIVSTNKSAEDEEKVSHAKKKHVSLSREFCYKTFI